MCKLVVTPWFCLLDPARHQTNLTVLQSVKLIAVLILKSWISAEAVGDTVKVFLE